jgi:hypothetical protein
VGASATPGDPNTIPEMSPADERIFNEYWKEHVVSDFRRQELTKLFATFLRSSTDIFFFLDNTDPLSQVPNSIQNPICLKDIRQRIQSQAYGDSFVTFQTDVELCFMNAMLFNAIDSVIHQAAARLTISFTNLVYVFKQRQVQSAKKSFSRASSKPNSVVAALVEQTQSEKLKHSLVPSAGTLLVVPTVLVDHWLVRKAENLNVVGWIHPLD